jgi:diphthamide biosynthesis methyltransferase
MLNFILQDFLEGSISSLEDTIGCEIKILTREEVEEENLPIKDAQNRDVAFLSAGDPLIATTHSEMLIEAKKIRIRNHCYTFIVYFICSTGNSWASGL